MNIYKRKPMPRRGWLLATLPALAGLVTQIQLKNEPTTLAVLSPNPRFDTGSTLVGTIESPSQATPKTEKPSEWQTTKCTFYGKPYDDGRRRLCADGKTVYTTNGRFCATGLAPLGSTIELKRNGKVLRLKVADRQAPKFRHLIDLPTGTWAYFGDSYSKGKITVQWRIIHEATPQKAKTNPMDAIDS